MDKEKITPKTAPTKDVSTELIEQIYHFINMASEHITAHGFNTIEWENTGLESISLSECHIIDFIGTHRLCNSTIISQGMKITKGGISKINARLLKKGLIEAHQLKDNRKEVFYQLTPAGKKIFALHQKVHQSAQDKITKAIAAYSPQEQQIIKSFLQNMISLFGNDLPEDH